MANVLIRATVWIGALLWWAYLKKPAGSSFLEVRTGPARLVGLGLIAAGGSLGLWSMLTLAGGVRTPLAPPTELLTRGPYKHVRNPLYLAAAALFGGISTVYVPWTVSDVFRAILLAVIVHVVVVRLEEPATRKRLGPAYEEYCRRVPRWIPGIRG
jgi:protein-S-isoprenylcysteine O-methyltransferase Ste14